MAGPGTFISRLLGEPATYSAIAAMLALIGGAATGQLAWEYAIGGILTSLGGMLIPERAAPERGGVPTTETRSDNAADPGRR